MHHDDAGQLIIGMAALENQEAGLSPGGALCEFKFRVKNTPKGEIDFALADAGLIGIGRVAAQQLYTIPLQLNKKEAFEKTIVLEQNYPNPFARHSAIQFSILEKSSGKVVLSIFNPEGQLVNTLVDRFLLPGTYTINYDGKNSAGNELAEGVYYYKLQFGQAVETKRMVITR